MASCDGIARRWRPSQQDNHLLGLLDTIDSHINIDIDRLLNQNGVAAPEDVSDADAFAFLRRLSMLVWPDDHADDPAPASAATIAVAEPSTEVTVAKDTTCSETAPAEPAAAKPVAITVPAQPPHAEIAAPSGEKPSTQKERCLELYLAGTKEVAAIVEATGFENASVQSCLSVLREEGAIPEEPKDAILAVYWKDHRTPDEIWKVTGFPLPSIKKYLFTLRQEGSIPAETERQTAIQTCPTCLNKIKRRKNRMSAPKRRSWRFGTRALAARPRSPRVPTLRRRRTTSKKSQPIPATDRTFRNHLNTFHLNRLPKTYDKPRKTPISLRGKTRAIAFASRSPLPLAGEGDTTAPAPNAIAVGARRSSSPTISARAVEAWMSPRPTSLRLEVTLSCSVG